MGRRINRLRNATEKVLKQVSRRSHQSAFDVYSRLDLGPGGYALAPSTNTRRGMQLALHRRKPRR